MEATQTELELDTTIYNPNDDDDDDSVDDHCIAAYT